MDPTVQKMIASPKGVLAADESSGTIEKRFASLGLTSTSELNRKYRQMLLTTLGLENYIGGVILFDETAKQKTDDGILFPKYLEQKGIVPGIKVDQGKEDYKDTKQQITKGLEGLSESLKEYYQMGLRFTKWRGVVQISDLYPTDEFLNDNLSVMAKYAKVSQDEGFIPIVEPEVLLDGNHTTTRCETTLTKTLIILFEHLQKENVDLSKTILKTSMVLPGKESGVSAEPSEVAQATLRAFDNSIPRELGGIVFLSGGQTPDQATNNLNEIEKQKGERVWPISFSFARALQQEAMEAWAGKDENIKKAQEVFLRRLELVGKARKGEL